MICAVPNTGGLDNSQWENQEVGDIRNRSESGKINAKFCWFSGQIQIGDAWKFSSDASYDNVYITAVMKTSALHAV